MQFSQIMRTWHVQRFIFKKFFKSCIASSILSTDEGLRVIRNVMPKYTSQWQRKQHLLSTMSSPVYIYSIFKHIKHSVSFWETSTATLMRSLEVAREGWDHKFKSWILSAEDNYWLNSYHNCSAVIVCLCLTF